MKSTLRKNCSGLTLIEIMVAITVVTVGVLGSAMYRYRSALDAREADVQVGAGRVAMLILQGWKGAAGAAGYDPQGTGGIGVLNTNGISIPSVSGDVYTVLLSGETNTYYYAKLVKPSVEDAGIRKLEVLVTYYGEGSNDIKLPSKTVKLSDFVRIN